MKYLVPFIILSVAVAARAEEVARGAEGHTEVPVKLIIYQAINMLIIVVGLVYFLRAGVKKFFLEKKAVFMTAAERAETARKSAEQEHMKIQVKLTTLESTADESISRARAEAADMKMQLVVEAEALSKRIREEGEITARIEVEKAKRELRQTLIKDSIDAAKSNLSTKVSSEDQKRLQTDFIHNIQAAQK